MLVLLWTVFNSNTGNEVIKEAQILLYIQMWHQLLDKPYRLCLNEDWFIHCEQNQTESLVEAHNEVHVGVH